MATRVVLLGWNVHVEKVKQTVKGDNGLPKEEDAYKLVFSEVDTDNTIVFMHAKHVADYLVREYTGVILPGL
ncbi:MAG: hypothetical protein K0S82_56 [Gaiellaceae bacterium]|jgi:hypothetical protein|nr:hypothetical protein [Gaiellaceae bacterium]